MSGKLYFLFKNKNVMVTKQETFLTAILSNRWLRIQQRCLPTRPDLGRWLHILL